MNHFYPFKNFNCLIEEGMHYTLTKREGEIPDLAGLAIMNEKKILF